MLARSFNRMAADLEAARDAERRFLLSVSHELKTPLTAIRGYSEALQEGAVEPRDAGDVLAREGGRLERLVQDLLDLARVNARSFTVRRQPVELAEVAGEVVRRYEPRARGFGVGLAVRLDEPSLVLADPDRLLQVVSNLVENALRTTPAGGEVTVAARGPAISVADDGPGIETLDLPRAFDRFFLHDRYRGERSVGTGLGLAIVKELVEAMGGSVGVRSSLGSGSTFTVTLPVGG